jgi:phage baseplate assembly protein V
VSSKNLFSHKPGSPGGDVHNVQQGRLALRWGKVVEVSPEFSQVRVETDELDEIPTFWLSVIYPKTWHDKYYWMPELDEHVWFLWDEQGEEGIVLGAFYCADVEHEPGQSVHKTEVVWGDRSFFKYDREEHRLDWDIKGEIHIRAANGDLDLESSETMNLRAREIRLEACERIVLQAPEIVIEGAITMNGGLGGIAMLGANFMAGGIPISGIGSLVQTPVGPGTVVSGILGGLPGAPLIGPPCPPPEAPEVVPDDLEGDLRELKGYTPPGYGG